MDEDEIDDDDDEGSFVDVTASGDVGKKKNKGDYFERNLRTLRMITTNLGAQQDTSSLGGIEYPHGGKPPIELDIEVNRDTKHHTWQLDTANAMICSNLQWSAELINFRQTKSNIGGNILYDLFTIRNETTIQPLQLQLENIANYLLANICEKEGGDGDFKMFGIKLPDVISSMLDRFNNVGRSNPIDNNNPAPVNTEDQEENDDQ